MNTYNVQISLFVDGWQSYANSGRVWNKNALWVTIAISFSFLVHSLQENFVLVLNILHVAYCSFKIAG